MIIQKFCVAKNQILNSKSEFNFTNMYTNKYNLTLKSEHNMPKKPFNLKQSNNSVQNGDFFLKTNQKMLEDIYLSRQLLS